LTIEYYLSILNNKLSKKEYYMPKYLKKVQVLLTEKQYKDLEEIASRHQKKLGTLVREAIEEYHLKKKKEREIAEAAD